VTAEVAAADEVAKEVVVTEGVDSALTDVAALEDAATVVATEAEDEVAAEDVGAAAAEDPRMVTVITTVLTGRAIEPSDVDEPGVAVAVTISVLTLVVLALWAAVLVAAPDLTSCVEHLRSSRTRFSPLEPVTGVRVMVQVSMTVPANLQKGQRSV
jgi:hypothetical protein